MPSAIKALLVNPTYMFISFGAAADGLVIAGLSAFAPKFIQSQYKFTPAFSAAIVGKNKSVCDPFLSFHSCAPLSLSLSFYPDKIYQCITSQPKAGRNT